MESVIEERIWGGERRESIILFYLYQNFGLYKLRIVIFLNKILVKSEFSPGNCLIKFSNISRSN